MIQNISNFQNYINLIKVVALLNKLIKTMGHNLNKVKEIAYLQNQTKGKLLLYHK